MRQNRSLKASTAAFLLGLAVASAAAASTVASASPHERSSARADGGTDAVAPWHAAPWTCPAPGTACDAFGAGVDAVTPSFEILSAAPTAPGPASPAAADAPDDAFGLPALLLATLGVVSFNAFRRSSQRPLRPTRPSS